MLLIWASCIVAASLNSTTRELQALEQEPSRTRPPCATGGLHALCVDSGCCADPALACYKRPNHEFAQCLPRQAQCKDSSEWLCPGWELCSPRFGNCRKSQCCKHQSDVCYQKNEAFAQCRSLGDCIGRRDPMSKEPWLCSVLHEPDTCSADWQECTASKCCASPGFTCFEKSDGYARCLRECPDPASPPEWQRQYSCRIHDKAQVDTRQLLPQHHSRSQSTCSPNHGECTVAGCCASPGYSCYEHGPHFAMCLPTGTCETFWPNTSHATCAVKERKNECAGPSGDCSQSTCCSDPGYKCFQKDSVSHEARCMRGCSSYGEGLEGWECNLIDKNINPPPAPPPPPPQPYYRPTYDTTCKTFASKQSIHSRSCSEITDGASCNSHYRESQSILPSTPFAHVLEPCVWVFFAKKCAQGGPVECTPAMIAAAN